MHPTRIFKTPEELLKVWNDYKKDIQEQEAKWVKVQYVGKDGDRVTDPVKIPYTLEGLKRYCWDKEIGDISSYFTNDRQLYNDFTIICSRIKNEIREHQIIGGMNGFFNPSITQRLNGLTDKTETNTTTTIKLFNIDPLTE
jgi:hypothetical protein